jgi:hypothetical protein
MPRLPENFRDPLREERRLDSTLAAKFVRACLANDSDAMTEAAEELSEMGVNAWNLAFRRIARTKWKCTGELQAAFRDTWVQSKSLRLRAGEDRTVIAALRVLMPRYRGGSIRLFRGTSALERKRRVYGLSWTVSIDVAEKFALRWGRVHGGVILETLAPAKAVISKIEYPKPLTPNELTKLGLPHGIHVVEYHQEREYLVDRRLLTAVKVIRRYAPTHAPGCGA